MDTTNRVMKEIMRKVRDARKRAGLTQSDVAKALDVRQQTYNGYETGARTMSIPDLVKLPSILGVPITSLLPDSVVSDYDRARARDEILDYVVAGWDQLPKDAKTTIAHIVRSEVERKR